MSVVTVVNAVSLINGTQTLATYTVPDDGTEHVFFVDGQTVVGSAMTGGELQCIWTAGGHTFTATIDAGGHGTGGYSWTHKGGTCDPNTTVKITQATALTAGAATANGCIVAN